MIKAQFKSYGSYVTDSVYQWDLNQELQIVGIEVTKAPVIAFSNRMVIEAIPVQSELSNGVIKSIIPNVLLQKADNIVAHLCEKVNGKYKTFEKIVIPVKKRKIPSDYTYMDNVPADTYALMVKVREDLEILNEGGLILKDEVINQYTKKWLDDHPEATTTVQDKSLEISKLTDTARLFLYKDYVIPEMFGAVGDGVTDDTKAIINTINFGIENNIPVFAFKKYATSETLTISGLRFNFYLYGEIIYSGTDEAILITNCSHSNFIFTKISALNGTCIRMYSNSNSNNSVSYCDLSFKFLNSLENCIKIEIDANDGYCNENIIRGGWLASGKYGIYADAKGRSEIQFKAYNVGFEGVESGFYLNGTSYCTFIAPRYAEQSKILKARNAKHILIIATDKFYTTKIDIDDTVTGQIIAPISESGGGVYGYRGIFNNGYVHPIDKTNDYLNAYKSIDLTTEENYVTKLPKYFLVNNNCNYIKLNKMYGSTLSVFIGINEFTCKFNFDNGKDFKIYDAEGNIIFNNTSNCGWKECRFNYYQSTGWKCEILNSITNLVI